MRSIEGVLLRRPIIRVVAIVAVLSMIALTWLGYVAVRRWQATVAQLSDRQAADVCDLLLSALNRDMQAVQRSTLLSPDLGSDSTGLANAVDLVSVTFAAYSYPESFLVWNGETAGPPVFLHRRDRQPPWSEQLPSARPSPVVVSAEPTAQRLLDHIRADVAIGRRYSIFDINLGGTAYQVVARISYADRLRQRVALVFGFTVNLSWVRQHYFAEVLQRTAPIAGPSAELTLAVLNEDGEVIAGSDATPSRNVTVSRTFPLFFFNPLLVAARVPLDLRRAVWTVDVWPRQGSSLLLSSAVADRMLLLQAMAAATLCFGLWLAVRSARSNMQLAQMRNDLVSSVTHEFKTPISTIAGAGELLAAGQIRDIKRQREYAGFIVHEARRLSRLVDNLLAFSRITDTSVAERHLEWVKPADLIGLALQRFAFPIADGKFEVTVDAPRTLPPIFGDAAALRLMLENLIDNAIRHARNEKQFAVKASTDVGNVLLLEVEDRGGGIPADELSLVTRRFYRGRKSGQGGTGLGLTIATRIARDHGGTLAISAKSDVGTTVRVSLPPCVNAPGRDMSPAPAVGATEDVCQ